MWTAALSSSETDPAAAAEAILMQVLECGDLGRSHESMQCWRPFAQSGAVAAALVAEALASFTTTTTVTAPTTAGATTPATTGRSTAAGPTSNLGSTSTTGPGGGTGSSGSGDVDALPVALAAAAGGLLLLSVLVVVLLMRRNKTTTTASKTPVTNIAGGATLGRSVLAFENPMSVDTRAVLFWGGGAGAGEGWLFEVE